jgi:CRISPR/Cas system-associated exonuclease Cas4 (RecB family)
MEYQLVYQLFPRSFGITEDIKAVIACFEKNYEYIKSPDNSLNSDGVLKVIAEDLKRLKFKVEESKASIDKIKVPVLFSLNNRIDKFFDADAVSADGKIVIEVEAGRAYRNNQFLKDIFQACMMPNAEYLVIAVRNHYYNSDDFKSIFQFLETLYISVRLQLPLKGIVLIGY